MKIFIESSSIFTGKVTLVFLSMARMMSVFSLDRFSFSAAWLIVIFAFSSVMLCQRYFCF